MKAIYILLIALTLFNTSCRSNKATVKVTHPVNCIIFIYPANQSLTAPKTVVLEDTLDLVPAL